MKSQIHELIKNNRNIVSKTLILSIAFAFISTLGFSQDTETQEGQTITVTVSNLKNSNGIVSLALHNGDTFMKADGIQKTESTITYGKATVTFTNVTPGEYAVLVLHDENENKRMDFDANGMPQEAYGTSGVTNRFGPPSYKDAKFNLDKEDLELSIKL